MAEAIVNARLGKVWQAFSAGTNPSGYVHPKATAALAEIGIYHKGESKHTDEFRDANLELIITVCDSADKNCPIWLGKGEKIHCSFEDPAEAAGTEEEIMNVFRMVRDQIAKEIPLILHNFETDMTR